MEFFVHKTRTSLPEQLLGTDSSLLLDYHLLLSDIEWKGRDGKSLRWNSIPLVPFVDILCEGAFLSPGDKYEGVPPANEDSIVLGVENDVLNVYSYACNASISGSFGSLPELIERALGSIRDGLKSIPLGLEDEGISDRLEAIEHDFLEMGR